jgi:hypothetical protein
MAKVIDVNVQTGEVIERDMNPAEIAQAKIDEAENKAMKEAKANQELAKSALLERLGINAEEAKLLLA